MTLELAVDDASVVHPALTPDAIEREGTRVLRRLCERGAVLAVAENMEKAVVVRDLGDGSTARTGTVDREVAEALVLRDWIAPTKASHRIARYQITSAGRAALKTLLAEQENRAVRGMSEAPAHFAPAPLEGTRTSGFETAGRPRRPTFVESPLVGLSRRRDKTGQPFLTEDLVGVGERLREDFELAQMEPLGLEEWEAIMRSTAPKPSVSNAPGPDAARDRVNLALRDLGPGLGDVVLRCCCFLEGLEAAEKRMGWSARSGKIVLRIALQRLRRHYEETHGRYGPMIG